MQIKRGSEEYSKLLYVFQDEYTGWGYGNLLEDFEEELIAKGYSIS